MIKPAALLAAAAVAVTTAQPPPIPKQYTAHVLSDVKGNIPNIPKGKSTYTEYYDYGNTRRRIDFSDGTSKVYRYDVNDMGHNPFPCLLYTSDAADE